MKIGLTLGKFAPFHYGHRFLIQTALDEMDKVIVMAYEDDCINIPVQKRADWIRKSFKENIQNMEIIGCYDGPQAVGYTDEIMKKHEDYILDKVGDKKITHFYSSEKYGDHVSKALKAVDRRVDMLHQTVAISGTKIRNNPYNSKHYMPPHVYKDLIQKVAFLGAESTGKTTMAKVCSKIFNTKMVPEYGENYWHENNKKGILTMSDLEFIAKEQIALENNLIYNANKYLFCDTSPLTTYMFSNKVSVICEKMKAYYAYLICLEAMLC